MTSDAYTEAWLAGPQKTQFYTRTYLAPPASSKAVLVFIHGFAEHIGRYTEAHPQLAAAGVNVFTFDERGFGKTALDEEHKSKSSAYGKTSGEDQMDDICWAIEHARSTFPELPVFLCGHSMGGGEVLNFPIRRADAAKVLAGVIACSPIVRQTKPSSKVQRWLGGKVAMVTPYMTIPAPLDFGHLTHDAAYNKMCETDPLAQLKGSLRGISDMLNWGDELLLKTHKNWPKALPVLFLHGTGDQITCHAAATEFYDKIVSDDKNMIYYEDGFHELLHEPAHREKMLADMVAFVEAHLPKSAAPASVAPESKIVEAKL
ncbi:Alpha/Beta hydrolase protein [Mycena belliarum]|uniref:Alpha/Beta hydrolase protein n=1 Tax=Mycena belliarum TaxID=1033014 RepID=A0AAD6UK68_9AGAR|nr:Alpha/Beta hydrolase protein [Mycena belliae]